MMRRLLFFAIVVSGLLMLAAPAFAFDGYRADYTPTAQCALCHSSSSGFPGVPPVYEKWAMTAHADKVQTSAISRGSGCAVCHVSNYDPGKHVPPAAGSPYPTEDSAGDDAFSEVGVGCSSCHVTQNSAHWVPKPNMANADVCGQCHARYSSTVATYPAWTWPSGSPSPVPTEVALQGTLGDFDPLGTQGAGPNDPWVNASPLADFLSIPTVAAPQRGRLWPSGHMASAHGEGAAQYDEWAGEGHADALEQLKAIGQGSNPECLECHSTDYRLAVEAGLPMNPSSAKYGVTCIGCHLPHEEGSQSSVWNKDKNPQLVSRRQDLCVQCHNGEIAAQANGQPGVATAGQAVHHPQKEMMDGTGAIDVPEGGPGVHKGRCVQCHMPPTGYEHDGATATAGNHLFAIITPEQAETTTLDFGSSGVKPMPYSACTTCHSRSGDDRAIWLQDTMTDRRAIMHKWDAQVTEALATAAGHLGYQGVDDAAAIDAANTAINAKPAASWTARELAFQKAFTNQSFVESEGSWGIHNWQYASAVILKARDQARSIQAQAAAPWTITFKASKTAVRRYQRVRLRGTVKTASGVAGSGVITIQKRWAGGHWSTWRKVRLNSSGSFSRLVRLNRHGSIYWRVVMPAGGDNLKTVTKSVRIRVR